jgi:hypothetical protein
VTVEEVGDDYIFEYDGPPLAPAEDIATDDTGDVVSNQVPSIEGSRELHRWSRDFTKVIAQLEGVWDITTGEEKILQKPSREAHLLSLAERPYGAARSKSKATEKNRNRVRPASALIIYWVGPIRDGWVAFMLLWGN